MPSSTRHLQPSTAAAPARRPTARTIAWGFLPLCGLLGAPALAQTAGQLLEETRRPNAPALPTAPLPRLIEAPVRPTVTMPEGMTVAVSGFRISGATSFPDETLAALVKPWEGRRLDIAGLNEAAGAITRHYQAAGHLLSYAYLPAQRVADGVIELAVLEGRVDGVQIVAAQDVRLRDEVVQAHAERLTQPGPLLQAGVERQMLLLNDIPGVTARAAFTPGASSGTADVVISVAEDDPLELRGELNNHGTKSTGLYRAGFSLQLRDLFGWGDTSSARAFASNKGSLVNGSLATSVPVGGDGFKLGANLSHLKYQLDGQFKRLGATGSADVVGVDASYPFVRTPDANFGVKAGLEYRRLHDATFLGTVNQKQNQVAELTASLDLRDRFGGASAASATAEMGQLRSAGAASIDWRKLGVQAARQQAITGPWSLYGRVSTQYSGSNLDSAEKMGLGGPGAVRAYAAGEAAVDLGSLVSLELRYAQDLLGGGVVVSLFHDQASGRKSRSPAAEAGNRVRLLANGLGLTWNGGGYGLNASLAWRGSRLPEADGSDPSARLFLQLFVTP